jgi:hypothetical protein
LARLRWFDRWTGADLCGDLTLREWIEFWQALRSGNRAGRRRRSVWRHDDIASGVLRRIAEGDLAPGSPFPAVSTRGQVPLQTIRRSVRSLLQDGFLRAGPDSELYIAHEVSPSMRRRVSDALASGEPLDLAEAAAFEIIVHSRRVDTS